MSFLSFKAVGVNLYPKSNAIYLSKLNFYLLKLHFILMRKTCIRVYIICRFYYCKMCFCIYNNSFWPYQKNRDSLLNYKLIKSKSETPFQYSIPIGIPEFYILNILIIDSYQLTSIPKVY